MSGGRNDYLEDIKNGLMNLTTGNGFQNDIKQVVRKTLSVDQVHDFPILMVLGGREPFEGGFGGEETGDLNIKIRGYSRDTVNPEVALNSLIDDVTKLIYSGHNPHLNATRIESVDTDEGWLNLESEGTAMLEFNVIVKREFNPSQL